jgi:hypothetical protein
MMARERNGSGYIALLNMHGHPHADSRGRVLEHIHLASAALGRPLPKGAEIHHVNEIRCNEIHNLRRLLLLPSAF